MTDWVGNILALGPKNLIVSLGKEGAMLVTNQGLGNDSFSQHH